MRLHEFTVKDINGIDKKLSEFEGKPILIVNVASKCGFTPQYEDLQKLYEKYQNKMEILGFPCNQFGKQEAGTEEEIKEFCRVNYGVTFPMFAKLEVKGENISPIYKFLNNEANDEPKWNFHKYLVDKEGKVVSSYRSQVSPLGNEIIEKINDLLD
ncbi:MAG: glutathione peroxidase [Candidatus Hodarchaeales archaeon]|jgi:glutathione peroxidase